MEDKSCGTCFFYRPYRNPDTGRVKSSEKGNCYYPVQWPRMPESYHAGFRGYIQYPTRFNVWPQNGKDCECWGELL